MVLAYLPGSELACKEITEMALQFLCARHPQYFSLSEDTERGYVLDGPVKLSHPHLSHLRQTSSWAFF